MPQRDKIRREEFCQLVDRCLNDDQQAMLQLVELHKSRVFGLCYRMLNHRQDAEDMTQETFVRVLKNLHRWDPERDFEPWLLAIAGNRCRTMLTSRKRRPEASPLVDHLPDESHNLQAAETLAEEVQLAMAEIREEYRQAFILFHEHEMSYIEISQTMDSPIGTIKTWIHRARREIIQRLSRRDVIQEKKHVMREI